MAGQTASTSSAITPFSNQTVDCQSAADGMVHVYQEESTSTLYTYAHHMLPITTFTCDEPSYSALCSVSTTSCPRYDSIKCLGPRSPGFDLSVFHGPPCACSRFHGLDSFLLRYAFWFCKHKLDFQDSNYLLHLQRVSLACSSNSGKLQAHS